MHSELVRLVGSPTPSEMVALLRRRKDLSQHAVAVATNIPAPMISMIERGVQAPQRFLDDLCRHFEQAGGKSLDEQVQEPTDREALFLLRRRYRLNQKAVSAATCIPATVLCMIERGSRDPKRHLDALCEFYRQVVSGEEPTHANRSRSTRL